MDSGFDDRFEKLKRLKRPERWLFFYFSGFPHLSNLYNLLRTYGKKWQWCTLAYTFPHIP
jgi:hypothetical protein